MAAKNNICQGISGFSIWDQQKFCCLWDNDQDHGNFEEPLYQGKLFEAKS